MAGQSFNINQLPPATVNLIGSGQVITSVYSVIKELVENSVDAGATSLDIRIDNFGLDKIEVSDNGHGLSAIDVPFLAKRHYTSKLSCTSDMNTLQTYGFRGEALASLCAVSDLKVTTKTEQDDLSYVYSFDQEGNIIDKKPSHLGKGTTVTVVKLFYNIPVRKQYYSSSQRRKEDLKKVEDLLMAFSIIKPQLRIVFRHNKELMLQKLPANNTKDALTSVLGRQVASQLVFKEKAINEIGAKVSVYVPKPGSDVRIMSRSTGDRSFIAVNDRPVFLKELLKVVKQYYNNCHPCDATRLPVCYVQVILPTTDVDVNVDPNKTIVFLQHMKEIQMCSEEILLELYGPLDNVPSWHYSQSSEGIAQQSLAADDKKLSSEEEEVTRDRTTKVKVSNHMVYSRVQTNDAMMTHQMNDNQTDKSKMENNQNNNTLYLDVNVSLHSEGNSKNSPDLSHGVPDESLAISEILSLNDRHLDDFNHANAPKVNLQNDVTPGTPAGGVSHSLFDVPTSEKINEATSDVEVALSHGDSLQNISVKDKTATSLEGHAYFSSSFLTDNFDNTPLTEAAEGTGGDNQLGTISTTTGSSWSRGNWISDVQGKLLQPVQLLAPSSKHIPGKHALSKEGVHTECPAKRRRTLTETLDPNQTTLDDVMDNKSRMAVSISAESQANGEERLKPSDSILDEADLAKMKSKESLNGMKNNQPTKALKQSVRDQVAVMASQSQAEKVKKSLKRKRYHTEQKVDIDLCLLRCALEKKVTDDNSILFSKPTVIGHDNLCDAWFCCHGNTMSLVNDHRLGEVTLYYKLRATHRLLLSPCQIPVALNYRGISESIWSTLNLLAEENRTNDTYFTINDERIVANGFEVKCHFDLENKLHAELVGLCNLIPAYSCQDLYEVLDIINKNPKVILEDARPTKVLYYLQGEAVRMIQQIPCKRSASDVQDMLNHLPEAPELQLCVHHKPLFHNLCDLTDL
ncbi:unnamed protein product [Lymnaea stagnalis]|uniref:DNA mismatch repair protein S5 domain-containing protein n=1 Tax=Lymnaea stagnalis TaxID=6523 RepID=A0AAV2GYN0_LYMST